MIGITLTYLDDLTVLSSNYQALVAAYGLTGRFFQSWQVQLNPSKTAYLVNPRAKQQGRQIEGLLGCMTGWKPSGELLADRVAAGIRAARRLTMLPVSQQHYANLVATFAVSLLYGQEFQALLPETKRLDALLRQGCYGKVRVCANSHLQHLCFPSHKATAEGSRFQQVWRVIWQSAADERTRANLLQYWTSAFVPRTTGLWFSFIKLIQDCDGERRRPGRVTFGFPEPMITDTAMSKSPWQHHARMLWRRKEWALGAEKAGWALDGHRLDWQISLKGPRGRTTWMQTLQSNGLNSKSRSARHFGSAESADCEHGCGVPDDCHRHLLDCAALQRVRLMAGLNDADLNYLREMPSATASELWWVHPRISQPDLWTTDQQWGLWVSEEWINHATRDEFQHDLDITFSHASWKAGDHPQVQRHGAELRYPEGNWMPKRSRSIMEEATRAHWEADALMMAAALVLSTGRNVRLRGLAKDPVGLWSTISRGQASQRHLAGAMLAARDRIHVEDEQIPPSGDLLDFIRVNPNAVAAWNYSWALAGKVAALIAILPATHELFPVAAEISRRHGERVVLEDPDRGGSFALCGLSPHGTLPSTARYLFICGLWTLLLCSQRSLLAFALRCVFAWGVGVWWPGPCPPPMRLALVGCL